MISKLCSPLLRSVFAIVLPLVMLASCASDADMKAFVGQPSSVLLAQMGTPKLRAPDGTGGEIWTYMDESAAVAPGMGPLGQGPRGSLGGGAAMQSAAPSTGFVSRREFLINSHGVVFQYRTRGH